MGIQSFRVLVISILIVLSQLAYGSHTDLCLAHYREYAESLTPPVDQTCYPMNNFPRFFQHICRTTSLIFASGAAGYGYYYIGQNQSAQKLGFESFSIIAGAFESMDFATAVYKYFKKRKYEEAKIVHDLLNEVYLEQGSLPILQTFLQSLNYSLEAKLNLNDLLMILKQALSFDNDGLCTFDPKNDGHVTSKPYSYKMIKNRIISDWNNHQGWAISNPANGNGDFFP